MDPREHSARAAAPEPARHKSLTDFTTLNARGERGRVPAAYRQNALAATHIHLDVEMETGTGKTY
jgi:type III restriction enzyme